MAEVEPDASTSLRSRVAAALRWTRRRAGALWARVRRRPPSSPSGAEAGDAGKAGEAGGAAAAASEAGAAPPTPVEAQAGPAAPAEPAPFDPAGELSELSGVWDSLAKTDPLWAILSEPHKRGRRWQLEEFFEEGRREIDDLMATLRRTGLVGAGRPGGRALDFGCGIGRLSRRLRDHYDEVVGVDIAPTMVELAQRLDRPAQPVRYVVNQEPHLRFVPDASVDLLYSNIVLQHMAPELATGYIAEFFRVVKPGGAVVFQIPSHLSESYLPAGWTETPLEDEACSARLEASIPEVVGPGEPLELEVGVVNTSPRPWLQRREQQLNLANHWLDERQEEIRHDDGRARLPGRLEPGERAVVPLTVTAPDQAGAYVLELDVVQEGVRWFADAGSPTLRRAVTVTSERRATENGPTGDPPVEAHEALAELFDPGAGSAAFKMAGVPREEILALVAELGGEVVRAEEHLTEWYSYKYFVRRTPPPDGPDGPDGAETPPAPLAAAPPPPPPADSDEVGDEQGGRPQ